MCMQLMLQVKKKDLKNTERISFYWEHNRLLRESRYSPKGPYLPSVFAKVMHLHYSKAKPGNTTSLYLPEKYFLS